MMIFLEENDEKIGQNMDNMIVNAVIGLVFIGLSFPLHEVMHWIPMKFYRLDTKLGLVRKDLTIMVSCDTRSLAQSEIILLSPLALDMPLLFCALLFLANFPDSTWYLLLVPLAMLWATFNSLHDLVEYRKQRRQTK